MLIIYYGVLGGPTLGVVPSALCFYIVYSRIGSWNDPELHMTVAFYRIVITSPHDDLRLL